MSETKCCAKCLTHKPVADYDPRLETCRDCWRAFRRARYRELAREGEEYAKQRMKELACKQQSK